MIRYNIWVGKNLIRIKKIECALLISCGTYFINSYILSTMLDLLIDNSYANISSCFPNHTQ